MAKLDQLCELKERENMVKCFEIIEQSHTKENPLEVYEAIWKTLPSVIDHHDYNIARMLKSSDVLKIVKGFYENKN